MIKSINILTINNKLTNFNKLILSKNYFKRNGKYNLILILIRIINRTSWIEIVVLDNNNSIKNKYKVKYLKKE